MNISARRLGTGAITKVVALLVAVSMVGLVAGGAQAATTGVTTHRPVLSSDYGQMKSHVKGSFGKGGTMTGTFTPRRYLVNGAGDLVAAGTLRATLTRASGKVVGTDTKRVRIPVKTIGGTPTSGTSSAAPQAAAAGSCDILNLVLGPLDLDLLGLQVHLDKVVLDITAAPGAGNLLGNLLCAVAGLLDGGPSGLLTQISQILNSILAILRLP